MSGHVARRTGVPPSGRRLPAIVVALAVLLLASCGLSRDGRPRAIRDKAVTDLVSPAPDVTSPTPSGSGTQVSLYFVRGDRLTRILAQANDKVTADRALRALLKGPPRPAAPRDVTTSIPPGTILRRTEVAGGTLRIDLSGNIKSIGGSSAKTAYAQLVFTALELPGLRRVRFSIEGDDIDAPTDDGALTLVTRSNYKSPLNPDAKPR